MRPCPTPGKAITVLFYYMCAKLSTAHFYFSRKSLVRGKKVCHNSTVHFVSCSGIEVVITGLTRNQFAGNRTWVRIPPAAPKRTPSAIGRRGFFLMWDSKPERVSGVKKTCQWHVFSREVRRSYASRTDDANEVKRHHPTRCAKHRNRFCLPRQMRFLLALGCKTLFAYV